MGAVSHSSSLTLKPSATHIERNSIPRPKNWQSFAKPHYISAIRRTNPSFIPFLLPVNDLIPLDRSTRFNYGGSGDPLRDAEALVSFIKMEDGLLSEDQVR